MQRFVEPSREIWPQITARPQIDKEDLSTLVLEILENVTSNGDAALKEYSEKFDGVTLNSLAVSESEFSLAQKQIDTKLKKAIHVARDNIEKFHKSQYITSAVIETMPGVSCWRKSVPIQNVGLYVPGGTAPLFSSVLMQAIPAKIANCPEIVLCTPPQKDGSIHPAILYCAKLIGISKIFKVGGAQAIAALSIGTESIPKVHKIFGPGNQYVTAAKQLVSTRGTSIDMPAGPSELAVYADDSSIPAFVAADLLSQAEHGPDSHVLLIVSQESILTAVEQEIAQQIEKLPRKEVAFKSLENSTYVVLENTEDAVSLLNEYAAEHLILATEKSSQLIDGIVNAGSVFVGNYSPESVGDYASGTNHVLPTNGEAKTYSGVSLDSFVKKITYQQITKKGLLEIAPSVEIMAKTEQLDGHAFAVEVRRDAIESESSTASASKNRTSKIERKTSETNISIEINLDGTGHSKIDTGLHFFDHMLEQIARHGMIDMRIFVDGDLEIDEHHTIEDTGLALGEAFLDALGDKAGISRYGFLLPMDESLAQVAIDFSGRNWLVWDAHFKREKIGKVPTEMFPHFFKSFCDAAKCNLNIKVEGKNEHHMIEAIFKAFAKAIRMAVARDERQTGIPSTKGTL